MRVPLFGIGMQSGTPVITAKRLTNIYAEYRPKGEKTQVVGLGFPGLDSFVDLGAMPSRGMIPVEQNDLLYVVNRSTFWQVNNAGATVSRGTIGTSSGAVYMAHNGTQVMIVDGSLGYIYNVNTLVFVQITDVDFPANPTSVTYQDGYFIVGYDSGRFYISAIHDGLTWDALDFATAESNPDKLQRVFSDHGEALLMGDISCEFWGSSGAADFPYAKLQGADAEWGLAARDSVVKFDDSVAFLCKNRMGQVIVGKVRGHSVEKLSTPDLDKIINAYTVVSDAVGFSYLLGGHPMYQLNFPTAGFSWSYDGLTKFWSVRKSVGMLKHRCLRGVSYLTSTVVSDADNGLLYKLNGDTTTENGDPIEGEIIGEHWDSEQATTTIHRLRLDMEVGTGASTTGTLTAWDGTGTLWDDGTTLWDYTPPRETQIMLQVSRDDGKTWGNEMWKGAGVLGDYKKIVEWRRLGASRRWTMKFRITDPVKRVFMGAFVNPRD